MTSVFPESIAIAASTDVRAELTQQARNIASSPLRPEMESAREPRHF